MERNEVAEVLKGLIRLDFDAIEAYEAAVNRLQDEQYRGQLREFMQDHERHTVNLAAELRRLDGEAPAGPGLMRALTEGAVVLGGLMHDKGILKAMSSNEAITNRKYESALRKLAGEAGIEAVVRQNREDERRHKDWIDATLDADRFPHDTAGHDRDTGESPRRDMR